MGRWGVSRKASALSMLGPARSSMFPTHGSAETLTKELPPSRIGDHGTMALEPVGRCASRPRRDIRSWSRFSGSPRSSYGGERDIHLLQEAGYPLGKLGFVDFVITRLRVLLECDEVVHSQEL